MHKWWRKVEDSRVQRKRSSKRIGIFVVVGFEHGLSES
jgi:hypothetical protein